MIRRLIDEKVGISMTFDTWKSKGKRWYCGFTIHWTSEDFQLKKATLAVYHMEDEEDEEILYEHLTEAMNEFGIEAKDLVAITHDEVSRMVNAVQNVKCHSVHCVAHMAHSSCKKFKAQTKTTLL